MQSEFLDEDLLSASVLLMSSRAEGFGLVAIKALAIGLPVFVSSRSGVGEFLKEALFGRKAAQYVVRTTDEIESDVSEWAKC